MRLPFFRSERPEEPIRIPLPELLHTRFGVYFRPDTAALPTSESLKSEIRAWLDTHATGPLQAGAQGYLDRDWLQVRVEPRAALPAPPMDLLRYVGAGELEERRCASASHVAGVAAPDAVGALRVGFWTAVAASRALADALGGVILDPELPRLQPIESHTESMPEDPGISIREQIIVFFSTDCRGLVWMTTKGMGKFGLPELEIRDVPPHMAERLTPVVNGLAHYLAIATAQTGADSVKPPRELRLGPEIRFGRADMAASPEPLPELPEGVRGWTYLRLEYRPGASGQSSFLSLRSPRGFRGDQGVWLNSLCGDLFGNEDTRRNVPKGSEAMEIAHRRAVEEFPEVKQRFAAGLPPGNKLLVKHGFATAKGGREYMWVVVNRWRGDRLSGQLANDPQICLHLRAGQSVEIREGAVFDWAILQPGGTMEGGYTIEVSEREHRERPKRG